MSEVDFLFFNRSRVSIGVRDETEPTITVLFSNPKSRQRFSVTLQLSTTYPDASDSLGSAVKIIDFNKTIGTVTLEMVNKIFHLESNASQTAQDSHQPLTRLCSCLEDLCLSLHY